MFISAIPYMEFDYYYFFFFCLKRYKKKKANPWTDLGKSSFSFLFIDS